MEDFVTSGNGGEGVKGRTVLRPGFGAQGLYYGIVVGG